MKRVPLLTLLTMAVILFATAAPQAAAQKKDKNQPAQPAAAPTPLPGTKLPPQAKTQEEFKAYSDTGQLTDPAALEAAADSFAEKFPASDLRYLLYFRAMFSYQGQNNVDKAVEMGKKVLALNPDEPSTLAMVAEMISERIGEPGESLDRDERLNEARQDAHRALLTVDTDLVVSPSAPPERVDQNKRMIRSTAYSALGNTDLSQKNFAEAEKNFKQSIDATPENPDGVTVLRYAIALDQQKKYPQALPVAERAVQLAPAGSPQAKMATQERDRLAQLTKAPPTPAPASQKPASATPAAPQSSK